MEQMSDAVESKLCSGLGYGHVRRGYLDIDPVLARSSKPKVRLTVTAPDYHVRTDFNLYIRGAGKVDSSQFRQGGTIRNPYSFNQLLRAGAVFNDTKSLSHGYHRKCRGCPSNNDARLKSLCVNPVSSQETLGSLKGIHNLCRSMSNDSALKPIAYNFVPSPWHLIRSLMTVCGSLCHFLPLTSV